VGKRVLATLFPHLWGLNRNCAKILNWAPEGKRKEDCKQHGIKKKRRKETIKACCTPWHEKHVAAQDRRH